MFFLIYGEDSFRSRSALRDTIAQFREKRDTSGLNVIRLKPGDGIIRAQEEMFSSPFLAERKLLVLEGFCGLPKKDQESLTENIGRKPESTVAIFFEEDNDKKLSKSPLFILLSEQKFTKNYPTPTPAEASRFASDEAAAAGVKFEVPALRRLMEAVGTDSWRIHQETQKLAAMATGYGRDTITAADVDETVSGSKEESIFAYIDSCTDGRGTKAMASLDALMSNGDAELQVISMLQRHFKTITMARDLMARKTDQRTAAQKLGVHPFAAKKAWSAATRYDSRFLGWCLRRLAKMERDLKTGMTRPRISLDIFTAELTERACAIKKPKG